MSGHIAKIIIEKGSVTTLRGEQSVELSSGDVVYLNEALHLSADGLAVIAFNNGKSVYLNNAHLDFTCDFESLVLKDVLNAEDQSIEETLLAIEQMEYMNTAFGLDAGLFSSFGAYMELYSVFTATSIGGLDGGYEAYSNIDDKSAINEVLISYLSDTVDYESLMSDLSIDGSDASSKAIFTAAVEQDLGNVLEGINNIGSAYDQGILTANDLISEAEDIINDSSFLEEYSDSVASYTDSLIDTVQGGVSSAIEITGSFAKDGLVLLSTTISDQIESLITPDPVAASVPVDLVNPLAGTFENVGDQSSWFTEDLDGTAGADFLNAGDGYDSSELEEGNDKLIIGDAKPDNLFATYIDAGEGDDVVQFGDNWDKVDFGSGDDILVLDDSLDFSALDTIVSNLEYIYLKAEATLENLSSQDLLDITDEDNILTIIGEESATFVVSDDWLLMDHDVGENNMTYHAQIQNSDLTLIVQNELMIDAS